MSAARNGSGVSRRRCVVLLQAWVWMGLLATAACTPMRATSTAPASDSAWPLERESSRQQVAELVQRARAARREQDYSKAKDLLNQAIALDPGHGNAQHLLGLIYSENGDLYNAAVHLDLASRLLKDRFEPCYNLGCVLEQGGQYDQAIRSYQQALNRRLNHLNTLENLARVRLKAGYHDQETLRILTRCVDREKRPEWSAWLNRETTRLRGRFEQDEHLPTLTHAADTPAAVGSDKSESTD